MKNTIILTIALLWSTISFGQWSVTGNNSLDPAINFLGNTDDKDLRFRTDDDPRMVLTGDKGWLGLHTMAPIAPFTIWRGDVLWYNDRIVDVQYWDIDKVASVPIEDDGIRLMWVDLRNTHPPKAGVVPCAA